MSELSPWQALLQQLDEQRPASLLYCSQTDQTALQHWCEHHDCQFTHIQAFSELEGLGRYDCVVVADWLEHAPAQEGMQSIARLRNLHTHAIWLLMPESPPKAQTESQETKRQSQETDKPHPNLELLSLGFQRLHSFGKNGLECYGYNLDRYNFKRDWNNPRFWANPDNWGKYWW